MAIATFDHGSLRQLANVLADAASHRELTDLFQAAGVAERGGNPKWERIHLALEARQAVDRCGNNVGAFVERLMAPVRYVARKEEYDQLRGRLNEVLAFAGMRVGENGRLRAVSAAATISEAQERAGRLRAELARRGVHHDVLQFCRAELLEQNYFHAILEAVKSVFDKVRVRTRLSSDGAPLVDSAFAIARPLLALSALRTESEQSEQKGFGNLLKGVFGVFRSPTAHDPKFRRSYGEQDALDLLTLVSYLHRAIDAAVRTPFPP